VTIAPAAGTIDGQDSLLLSFQWQECALATDGTDWYRVGGLTAPLELPATTADPLTTQGGSTLDYYGGAPGNAYFTYLDVGSYQPGGSPAEFAGPLSALHINPNPTTPALPTNPPVSGDVYQNLSGGPIRIKVPVTGGTAAGTVQWALGSASAPPNWGGAETIAISQVKNLDIDVPNGWYWSLTCGGTTAPTIGTASVLGS
jgi:hypothetical protein